MIVSLFIIIMPQIGGLCRNTQKKYYDTYTIKKKYATKKIIPPGFSINHNIIIFFTVILNLCMVKYMKIMSKNEN